MTEKTKKALKELALTILTAVVTFVTTIFLTSCGTTRAVITNHAQNTSTEVKITTNNPTTVNVDPNTTVSLSRDTK